MKQMTVHEVNTETGWRIMRMISDEQDVAGWNPCEDFNDTMKLVARMVGDGYTFRMQMTDRSSVTVMFDGSRSGKRGSLVRGMIGPAMDFGWCVCRAALKAVDENSKAVTLASRAG